MAAQDEDRRKYLDMLQAVISRMAANSFAIKGWSVASVSALLAFASAAKRVDVAVIALLPTGTFWLLDGFYLSLERRFRKRFESALAEPAASYTMSPMAAEKGTFWREACVSPSVWLVHAPVLIAVIAVAVVLHCWPSTIDQTVRVRLVDSVMVHGTVLQTTDRK